MGDKLSFVNIIRAELKDNPMITFSRNQLEAKGFGWVFDCEGVEVKEVENE